MIVILTIPDPRKSKSRCFSQIIMSKIALLNYLNKIDIEVYNYKFA